MASVSIQAAKKNHNNDEATAPEHQLEPGVQLPHPRETAVLVGEVDQDRGLAGPKNNKGNEGLGKKCRSCPKKTPKKPGTQIDSFPVVGWLVGGLVSDGGVTYACLVLPHACLVLPIGRVRVKRV